MPEDALTIDSLCAGLDAPDWLKRFEHAPGGEVIYGPGALSCLGDKVLALGVERVLLVTDKGLAKAGHPDRAQGIMEGVGLTVTRFDDVHENPTTEDVDRCVAVAREADAQIIVGLGGGSSMDTAKGCNFIYTNGGRMQDYWGVGKATKPMLPLIAVPTTSGTGSECQSFALIADAETHMKMACGDKKAAAAVAILDPELTLTQPPAVTALTGIDAVSHAVETAVCTKRTDISLAYSRVAFALLNQGFERVMTTPDDLEARARMQLGAAFAGTAIENSMLGAAHSCANPLTAHFGIVHGQAVGTMLPHVVRMNRQLDEAARIYESLNGGNLDERLEQLLRLARMDRTLADLGVGEDTLPGLAEEAAKQWTAQFNPVPITAVEAERLYRAAM